MCSQMLRKCLVARMGTHSPGLFRAVGCWG